jgi:thioredoxin-like negative regulator of GroEL
MRSRRVFVLAMAIMMPALIGACSGEVPAVTPAIISFTPATDRPTLIYFYAAECELCPQMQPVVDGMRAQYGDRVQFAYLDAASAGDMMARYDQTGYPSYVLLRKDGSVAWSFLGSRTPAQFAAEVERVLAGG